MSSLLSSLNVAERRELFENLNYLNVSEYRAFCDAHSIPYRIYVETPAGRRSAGDVDRKTVVLDRVRQFLKTGEVLEPTCFRARVVRLEGPPKRLTPADRLYYGYYEKKNPVVLGVLAKATGGRYKNGSIARVLMREFWTRGEAPTFAEFGKAWLRAKQEYAGPSPEYAFLTDLQRGKAGKDWKAERTRRAKIALRLLKKAGFASRPTPRTT